MYPNLVTFFSRRYSQSSLSGFEPETSPVGSRRANHWAGMTRILFKKLIVSLLYFYETAIIIHSHPFHLFQNIRFSTKKFPRTITKCLSVSNFKMQSIGLARRLKTQGSLVIWPEEEPKNVAFFVLKCNQTKMVGKPAAKRKSLRS